ncbi:MAG: glycosyltransferase family 2 protein [Pirellulales bacterium]
MAIHPPRVSIGLPVYNGEQYLVQALESLLGQTFENIEVVVCDNASNDATEQICRDMAKSDSRLRYVRNDTNIGGFPNHNRVFQLSQGELFMWAGYDDLRHQDYVARCVEVLDNRPECAICYSQTQEIDAQGAPLTDREAILNTGDSSPAKRFHDLIGMDHQIEPIYGIIRSDILRKTKLEQSFPDSDRVLAAEISLHGPFFRIPDCLFYRRRHLENSISMYPSRYERMTWIAPQQASKVTFPYCRQLFEYFRSIRRAPLQWRERWRCYSYLLSWLRKYWNLLLHDCTYNAKQLMRPALNLVLGKL